MLGPEIVSLIYAPSRVLLSPCIVSHVCLQASIYDDPGLYGSGYSSRAVSLLCSSDCFSNVATTTAAHGCLWRDICPHVDAPVLSSSNHPQPSEYSWYSSGASSTRSSPAVSTSRPLPPCMMSHNATQKTDSPLHPLITRQKNSWSLGPKKINMLYRT